MSRLKYIKKFGFEIEGGWERSRYTAYQNEGLMKGDGSVEVDDSTPGEIATEPFTCMKEAWKFMNKYYPDEVNRTCGFHIHISMDEGHYVMLMEKEFFDAFIKWADKLGKKYGKRIPATYAPRLAGENRYCQKLFEPSKQVTGHGDRYTMLNYCYHQHKTLENRMFPGCKNAKTAFFLLVQYLCFVENYLEKAKAEAKTHAFEVECEQFEYKTTRVGETTCA